MKKCFFLSIEIDGLGQGPPGLPGEGPGPLAVTSLPGASGSWWTSVLAGRSGLKRLGAPGFARARKDKCDFFVLRTSFGHPFILPQKGQESPQEAPKKPQKPPKRLEALKEGESRSRHKGFP